MVQWANATYGKSGHRWCGWFEDLDRSGVTVERPALAKAVACAELNGAHIVVFDLSRYSRNVPEGLRALSLLAESNIEVKSASEHLDASTSEGELSLTMMLAVNQYQLKKYSENWRRLISENKKRGAWHGTVPFGYRRAKRADFPKGESLAGRIVPDETHAAHVKEIFRRYNSGESAHRIGLYAHNQGWYNRIETTRHILANPVYIGMVAQRETEVARNLEGQIRTDSHLRPLRRAKKNGKVELIEGLHKPLVTKKVFEKAQARLKKEARERAPKTTQPRWSATGRTRCESCGRLLHFIDKSDTVKGDARYLLCTNRFCEGKPGSVRVQELDQIVGRFISALPLVVVPQTNQLIKTAEREAREGSKRRSDLTKKLAKLREERVKATRRLLNDDLPSGMTRGDVETLLEVVRDEIEEVSSQLASLPESADVEIAPIKSLRDSTLTIAELWTKMDLAQQSEALELLGITFFIGKRRKYKDDLEDRVSVKMPFEIPAAEVFESARSEDSQR
jgi:DNA invertase Pin-like site-specific DNA recombinase